MEDTLVSGRREGTDRRIRLKERDAFMDHPRGCHTKSGRSREMLRRGMNKRNPGTFRNTRRHDSDAVPFRLRPVLRQTLALLSLGYYRHFSVSAVKTHGSGLALKLYSQVLMPAGLHVRQNPFFLLLSNVTFRYGNRGGFLGSLTIGFRSSLPSAKVIRRKRSSPCCTTSILVAVFAIAKELNLPRPVPPA